MSKQKNVTEKLQKHPVSAVEWVHRSELKANDYNPNSVAPAEKKLLKISIKESGWTTPIVVAPDMTIIDGFHRWSISGEQDIYSLTSGMVPVVILGEANPVHVRMATIRHNRARGTHNVTGMSDIVHFLMDEQGLTKDEVCTRLGMEEEEVVRLMFSKGIPKSEIVSGEFSKAWKPKND